MAQKKEKKKGFGKLLDAWIPPADAGDPIGCIATSFTFSPVFFEEECLGRFLQMETDPAEDGPSYLVEREEKLSQLVCAAALVDQHHCRGSRSLRWDLLPARMKKGIFHAKISLLHWSQLVRIIIASANLTEDGYRRNQEIFGTLDYKPGGKAPIGILSQIVKFLREGGRLSQEGDGSASASLVRWNDFLDRVLRVTQKWGVRDGEGKKGNPLIHLILTGQNRRNAVDQIGKLWPGNSPPFDAYVVSPFFDPPGRINKPAESLWNLLRKRGDARVNFYVNAEEIPGKETLFIHAPKSLLKAQPTRSGVRTNFWQFVHEADRPLHAKGIWLDDSRWALYMVGSSNFTSPGLGLGTQTNMEANLVYVVDSSRNGRAHNTLASSFPEGEKIGQKKNLKWQAMQDQGEDFAGRNIILPHSFGTAVYDQDEKQEGFVKLTIWGVPPKGWKLISEDNLAIFGEADWRSQGCPNEITLPWKFDRPPSGLWVKWIDTSIPAWWPINVETTTSLPPPEELKDLPLEALIDILTSARPLHQTMRRFLGRKRNNGKKKDDPNKHSPEIDPLKRVDSSGFLLQRTKRVSWALNGLRARIEKPAPTNECLQWRIFGPVGVNAVASALEREAKSDEEKAFLLTELAFELWRAKPCGAPGCLSANLVKKQLRLVIKDLRKRTPRGKFAMVGNLRKYVNKVYGTILD